jgi:4-amino-4-deoxy-L-arabinose transferase-like glycosyltransferase
MNWLKERRDSVMGRSLSFKKHGGIFLIILLYLGLALFNINYPGLDTDEAFNGVVSNNILRDVSDIANAQCLQSYVSISGKIIPVMAAQYSGPIIPYLARPFIALFGPGAFALRLCGILILAILLLFIYRLAGVWFGRRVGLLAALLTATNLSFVQYSRVGMFRVEIFVMAFFWIGLYLLIRYSQGKNFFFFCLGCLSLGLGFCTKITFLYYLVGLVPAYLILGRKLNLLRGFNFKKTLLSIFSFCLGSFFIIIYNFKQPGITFKQLFFALTDIKATGQNTIGMPANNLNYLYNLSVRISDLSGLLKGDLFTRWDWGVTRSSTLEKFLPAAAGLAVIAMLWGLFAALFLPGLSQLIRRRLLFLYTVYLALFFATPFTLSSFNQGHLLIIFPFPQVILALFLVYLGRGIKRKSKVFGKVFLWGLILPVVSLNIYMNIYFNLEMKRTGGYGRWSTAVSELVEYLQRKNIVSPVMFGYALHANLIFLTDNKIAPEIYDKFHAPLNRSVYAELFSSKSPVFYLTLTPEENKLKAMLNCQPGEVKGPGENLCAQLMDYSGEEGTDYRDLFLSFVRESGKKKELEKVFLNRAGAPVYWLYRIY